MEVLSATIREERDIKEFQIGKKEVILLLFADDTIVCIENPRDATRKLLELIKGFMKSQDIKLIYRKLLHFYILIKDQKGKLIKIIPFTTTLKRIIKLGINLPKEHRMCTPTTVRC